MPQRSILRSGSWLAAAVLAAALGACATTSGSGPVLALPGGYYLQPDQSFHTVLVDRQGHQVLHDTVAAYAVSQQVVAGAEGNPPTGSAGSYAVDLPFTGDAGTRYFVLDTASGRLQQDMDADAWHKSLQALKVPKDFRIYPPLRWRQLL